MRHRRLTDRRGRLVPLWVRFLAFGVLATYAIGLGHWALVESGARPRPPARAYDYNDEEAWLARRIDGLLTGGKNWDDLEGCAAVGYGWPMRSVASLFNDKVLPGRGRTVLVMAGIDLRARWPAAVGGGDHQRVVPTFPLIHQTAVNSAFWSIAAYLAFASARWWRRRGSNAVPCSRCGYDLSATPPDDVCPECGTAR